jgi:hypothetical protein
MAAQFLKNSRGQIRLSHLFVIVIHHYIEYDFDCELVAMIFFLESACIIRNLICVFGLYSRAC